jgi:hypothetical protein
MFQKDSLESKSGANPTNVSYLQSKRCEKRHD